MITFKEFCSTLNSALGLEHIVGEYAQNLTLGDSFESDALYECEFFCNVLVQYLQDGTWRIYTKDYNITNTGATHEEAHAARAAEIARSHTK